MGAMLAELIPYAKQIGALADSPLSVKIEERYLDPNWFRLHAEHQIVARSEYGSIMTSQEAIDEATDRYVSHLQRQIDRLRTEQACRTNQVDPPTLSSKASVPPVED